MERYPEAEHPRDDEGRLICPSCGVPDFIMGQGSQWGARLVTLGEVRDSAVYGAETEYTCGRCGHVWRVRWPDGSVPLG